jgi:phage terminase large subunit-like protein
VEPISPHGGDKAAKAQSFQGMAAMGRVWLPEGPEGDAILDELVRFPAGAHDEEVDNGAIIGRALMDAHPAIIPLQKHTPSTMAEQDWGMVLNTSKPNSARNLDA